MSDNDDLLGEDLGDHSLADYNLGNDEEDQLLADDYEGGASQNVPASMPPAFVETNHEYSRHTVEYNSQQSEYAQEPECVVPNITVEAVNAPRPLPTYAPYEPSCYETEVAVVPPAIPAAPIESPQIVPSDVGPPIRNGDLSAPRERFTSERPPGAQRMPQVRDIPDSLDKVFVPRGGYRGRTTWRNPQFVSRHPHPYRRNNQAHYNQFPQQRPMSPQTRPMSPQIRPDIPSSIRPDLPPGPSRMGPEISPERPILPQDHLFRPPPTDIRPSFQNFPPRFNNQPFRPNMDEPRSNFGQHVRPNFDQRPPYPYQQRPNFNPRFGPPVREMSPNHAGHMPQIIRQPLPGHSLTKPDEFGSKLSQREPEVRMLPVQLPPNLPPGGLAGKKVLINPHFRGNFQPPVDVMPSYTPTRIQKTPPLSPTLESKFGPIKDIEDAAERFIAEQNRALARAATRKLPRRSPQRFIENTTIEIQNDLANPRRQSEEDDLLRRQEEFIHANRAGLRRRMRSPTPPRVSRSLSPRRPSPPRREPNRAHERDRDEDSDYKRRLREQESLRERVLRAKEVRRRKNAVALQKQIEDRERENIDKDKPPRDNHSQPQLKEPTNNPTRVDTNRNPPINESAKPREISPPKAKDVGVSNTVTATYDNLTPPRETMPKPKTLSPERDLTPPLPDAIKTKSKDTKIEATKVDVNKSSDSKKLDRSQSDDELDLILDDIDDILSSDEDSGRFKEKPLKPEPPKAKPLADLRSRLPPKPAVDNSKRPWKKIIFDDEKNIRDSSPPSKRPVVTSSTKIEDSENIDKSKKTDTNTGYSRQRITFGCKLPAEPEKQKPDSQSKKQQPPFPNRRVVLQRKITQQPTKPSKLEKSVFSRVEVKNDPSKASIGIFSRAVRTAIGTGDKSRIVINKKTDDDPKVEYESESDLEDDDGGDDLLNDETGNVAHVKNLPHGMTDTRLKTLAGLDVQNLKLDKEERSAEIVFKTTSSAENFKKKFNNKMVAASRLSVNLL